MKLNKLKQGWTDRDWKWLMGVLIVFIIVLISIIFAKNIEIEANFSIISSAVSIALALVAIFFALKQDSDSRISHDTLITRLENIIREVGSVKDQVAHISKTDIQEIKEKAYENTKLDDQKTTYTKEEVDKLLQKTLSNFSEEVETKLKFEEIQKKVSASPIQMLSKRDLYETIRLLIKENGGKYNNSYIQNRIMDLFGISYSKDYIDEVYKIMREIEI